MIFPFNRCWYSKHSLKVKSFCLMQHVFILVPILTQAWRQGDQIYIQWIWLNPDDVRSLLLQFEFWDSFHVD